MGSVQLWQVTVVAVGANRTGVARSIGFRVADAALYPNDRVGIVEKLWSAAGSAPEGRIIVLGGEAGYQAELLAAVSHFGYWRWQYRVHQDAAGNDRQGKIGYVYARDGRRCRRARRWVVWSTAITFRTPASSCAGG